METTNVRKIKNSVNKLNKFVTFFFFFLNFRLDLTGHLKIHQLQVADLVLVNFYPSC